MEEVRCRRMQDEPCAEAEQPRADLIETESQSQHRYRIMENRERQVTFVDFLFCMVRSVPESRQGLVDSGFYRNVANHGPACPTQCSCKKPRFMSRHTKRRTHYATKDILYVVNYHEVVLNTAREHRSNIAG